MTFDEYQKQALTTDFGSNVEDRSVASLSFMSKVLGLVGETGEIAEKLKKVYRDDGGEMSDEQKADTIKELGDVVWYIAVLAEYLGYTFEDVAQANLDKLSSRKKRGTLPGSGDNR